MVDPEGIVDGDWRFFIGGVSYLYKNVVNIGENTQFCLQNAFFFADM